MYGAHTWQCVPNAGMCTVTCNLISCRSVTYKISTLNACNWRYVFGHMPFYVWNTYNTPARSLNRSVAWSLARSLAHKPFSRLRCIAFRMRFIYSTAPTGRIDCYTAATNISRRNWLHCASAAYAEPARQLTRILESMDLVLISLQWLRDRMTGRVCEIESEQRDKCVR